tara:strand:- start:3575 stop:4210 length:636 start_codon:yes stop_codon:yes gene_type:complete
MGSDRVKDAPNQGLLERYSLEIAAGVFVVGAAVSVLQESVGNYLDLNDRRPYAKEVEEFCTDPTVRPHYLGTKAPYKIDWDDAERLSVHTFKYEFNQTTEVNDPDNSIEAFVASIPQEVRDNPKAHLIVTGHADGGNLYVARGATETRKPRDFDAEVAQHEKNNRTIAQGRLDHFLQVANWPEDRLRVQNMGSDLSKKELNVQICFVEPEA